MKKTKGPDGNQAGKKIIERWQKVAMLPGVLALDG
jgi:hypothetical protein